VESRIAIAALTKMIRMLGKRKVGNLIERNHSITSNNKEDRTSCQYLEKIVLNGLQNIHNDKTSPMIAVIVILTGN